jgi:L-iditol 2-dehydrogenase
MLAELCAPHQFRLREQVLEAPPPGQVQVRVEAVGICGSDLHYFLKGQIGDMIARFPMVLGHEPVGTVVGLGDGVTGWSVGDRVALEAAMYCYHCEFCMVGRHNLCENVRFMSSPTEPGFFRDHVNVPVKNILPLPKNLGFAEGSLFEPIGIILHSMRYAQPAVGETAAVLGAGPIGLTTMAVLKLSGVSRVWMVEPLAHRRDLALAMGADAVIDPAQVDPVAEIRKETGGRGVDLAIDCCAKDDSINQSIYMTRPAGRTVITGVPTEEKYLIDFHAMRRKESGFFTVRRSNRTDEPALRMLSEHLNRFAPMITHRRMLSEVQPAFEMLESYSDGVGKIVIYPS